MSVDASANCFFDGVLENRCFADRRSSSGDGLAEVDNENGVRRGDFCAATKLCMSLGLIIRHLAANDKRFVVVVGVFVTFNRFNDNGVLAATSMLLFIISMRALDLSVDFGVNRLAAAALFFMADLKIVSGGARRLRGVPDVVVGVVKSTSTKLKTALLFRTAGDADDGVLYWLAGVAAAAVLIRLLCGVQQSEGEYDV